MHSLIYVIISSVFECTYITVPCLFFIQLFSITLPLINKKALIIAANYTFLLGSTLFVLKMLGEFFYSIFFEVGEYELYTVSNRYFGPYWFEVLPCFLPQILWIKKASQTTFVSFAILSVPFLIYIGNMVFPQPGWHMKVKPSIAGYLGWWSTYIIIISAIYFIYTKYHKDPERLT